MTIILMLQKILDRIKILILQNTLALLKLNNTPRETIFSSIIRQERRAKNSENTETKESNWM